MTIESFLFMCETLYFKTFEDADLTYGNRFCELKTSNMTKIPKFEVSETILGAKHNLNLY